MIFLRALLVVRTMNRLYPQNNKVMNNKPVPLRPLQRISLRKINATVLLFVAAILAMILANSPLASFYTDFLERPVVLQIGTIHLFVHNGHSMSVISFVNDALMSVFFLVVGLEIKQEILVGELSSMRKAFLPIVAAFGGMIVPVLLFLVFCHRSPEMNGAAIPMATDIAFALAVLALLGDRVPLSLKVFLTALAVVDDIGGILIIALFYSHGVAFGPLLLSLLILAVLFAAGRLGMNNNWFYYISGFFVWFLFLQSGIHPTIAGVLVAFAIPGQPVYQLDEYVKKIDKCRAELPSDLVRRTKNSTILTHHQVKSLRKIEKMTDMTISPLQNMTEDLHPWVNYFILPLFAFVNAGVALGNIEPSGLMGIPMGIFAGLFIGKTLGIFSFSYLLAKTGAVKFPPGMNKKNLFAISMLGGIGFTVSLFIANLSYASLPEIGAELLNEAKLGVFAGSLVSGAGGYWLLKKVLDKPAAKEKTGR